MPTDHEDPLATVTVQVVVNGHTAELLAHTWAGNLYDEQNDRFELITGFDSVLPSDPVFADGTMSWSNTASDALLLCGYERASGHTVALLWDLADDRGLVVLSSRQYLGT